MIDFGLSKKLNEENLTKTIVGTLYFMAPELILSKGEGYDPMLSDLYSVGVIIYYLLSKEYPFQKDVLYNGTGKIIYPSYFSKSIVNLLSCLLCVNPVERCSLQNVLDHPWWKETLSSSSDLSFLEIIELQKEIKSKNETIKLLERNLMSPLNHFVLKLKTLCVENGVTPKDDTPQEIYESIEKIINSKK